MVSTPNSSEIKTLGRKQCVRSPPRPLGTSRLDSAHTTAVCRQGATGKADQQFHPRTDLCFRKRAEEVSDIFRGLTKKAQPTKAEAVWAPRQAAQSTGRCGCLVSNHDFAWPPLTAGQSLHTRKEKTVTGLHSGHAMPDRG